MRIPIVIEHPTASGETFSAYAPDLDGVAATGQTEAECIAAMREALHLHVAGMAEDGIPLPDVLLHGERSAAIVEVPGA